LIFVSLKITILAGLKMHVCFTFSAFVCAWKTPRSISYLFRNRNHYVFAPNRTHCLLAPTQEKNFLTLMIA